MKIKKFFITLFILILIIYTMPISFASVNESDLDITSEAALLIDNNTGKILYGKNENEKNCRSGNDGKYGSSNSSWMWK